MPHHDCVWIGRLITLKLMLHCFMSHETYRAVWQKASTRKNSNNEYARWMGCKHKTQVVAHCIGCGWCHSTGWKLALDTALLDLSSQHLACCINIKYRFWAVRVQGWVCFLQAWRKVQQLKHTETTHGMQPEDNDHNRQRNFALLSCRIFWSSTFLFHLYLNKAQRCLLFTSSEGCDFALFIEGVRKALGGSQHLLVGWLEWFLEEFEGTNMCGSHPCSEPDSAKTHKGLQSSGMPTLRSSTCIQVHDGQKRSVIRREIHYWQGEM